jgi:rfaE bifunctional protein kinase chain/domain
MTHDLTRWIPKLAGNRILVIGDVILDEYITGSATRMSREAPVPVLEFQSRRMVPGGAANPSANIVALGSQALQVGVIGDDDHAANLSNALTERGIETSGLIIDSTRPTTVKTRIMAQMGLRFPQQVARLDHLSRQPIDKSIENKIVEYVSRQIDNVSAVLVSDYHTGLLTPSLADAIRSRANDVFLAADAQGELAKYAGFALVKCNADEARAYLQRDLISAEDFADAAAELCGSLALTGAMVITRGVDGATLSTAQGAIAHCPSPHVTDVYDTVGAGDTAIAVMTLASIAGADYPTAVTLANYASGIVVRHVGNYAPSPDEFLQALESWRID